jgi:hypothetical protein
MKQKICFYSLSSESICTPETCPADLDRCKVGIVTTKGAWEECFYGGKCRFSIALMLFAAQSRIIKLEALILDMEGVLNRVVAPDKTTWVSFDKKPVGGGT